MGFSKRRAQGVSYFQTRRLELLRTNEANHLSVTWRTECHISRTAMRHTGAVARNTRQALPRVLTLQPVRTSFPFTKSLALGESCRSSQAQGLNHFQIIQVQPGAPGKTRVTECRESDDNLPEPTRRSARAQPRAAPAGGPRRGREFVVRRGREGGNDWCS